ncbi:hypothetical protein ACH42_03555 [Endozoicomonas sp. (ex Bugula neritina AB1)]|nr:hypothetical protein ACH42_03555 [Endozoicomonas sp. (ex Bugula neritina AB1)]
MSFEILTALLLFAFVSSITPGPNNMMLMASGANWGLMRSLPHMLGVGIGFFLMVVVVGIGVMQLFELYPLSYKILQVVSVIYLLYLAYKISNAKSPEVKDKGKPITFMQAVLFQWVNPKAWTMAVTSISLYAPDRDFTSIAFVALVFGLVNFPSISAWAILGHHIQKWLCTPVRLKVFNWSMAGLLVASLLPSLKAVLV